MSDQITCTMDGQSLSIPPETTVLEAARSNKIFIPTLCNFEGLTPVGACRICLVEVKGIPRLLPACATKVSDGMEISTDSKRLKSHRKMILELLFAERNHVCSICVANGNCELQSMATTLGVTHSRFAYRYPKHDIDASHARFAHDPNRCILCTRCVRVCGDVEGAHTWDMMGRGIKSDVITDLNEEWGDSTTCTSCSKCVHVCPTGALFEKGKATGEMKKRENQLPFLAAMRKGRR